jgi:NAD-dependent deacetylase
VIGTSLVVYPAAGLVDYIPKNIPVFVVDPGKPTISGRNVFFIEEKAVNGVKLLREKLNKLK